MSEQPQTPYIGCKISLISMLDIRYEGILYSVNSEKSTIALSKVRSFGTEDRPTMHAVPARDEVYEYIIFKATDIKDLVVCTSSGLDYDPAIISVSAVAEPPDSQPSKETITDASLPSVAKSPPSSQWLFAQPHQLSQQASNAAADGATPAAAPPPTRATQGGFGQGRRGNVVAQPTAPVATATTVVAAATTTTYSNQAPKADVVNDFGGGGSTGGGGSGYRPWSAPKNQSSHTFNRPNNSNAGGYRMPPQSGGHAQQQHQPQQRNSRPVYHQSAGVGGGPVGQTVAAAPRDRIKFDNDFDFEEANEKFKEQLADVVENLSKVNVSESEENVENLERSEASSPVMTENADGETFYDKRTSFFDNISCEALEKTEGKNNRPDWKKERMTNQETFGHSAVRSLAYRRGPRGYSGPGGGGMPNRYQQQHQYGGGSGMQQNRYQPQQQYGGGMQQNRYHHQQQHYGGGGGGVPASGSSNNNRYRHYNNSNGNQSTQPRQYYGYGAAHQGYAK